MCLAAARFTPQVAARARTHTPHVAGRPAGSLPFHGHCGPLDRPRNRRGTQAERPPQSRLEARPTGPCVRARSRRRNPDADARGRESGSILPRLRVRLGFVFVLFFGRSIIVVTYIHTYTRDDDDDDVDLDSLREIKGAIDSSVLC